VRNRYRELPSQCPRQGCIEDLTELAVVPNGPGAATCEAVLQIVADTSVVVQNGLGVVDLIGKGDEKRRCRFGGKIER